MKVLVVQVEGIALKVTVFNLKDPEPEFKKTAAGVRVRFPQAAACEIP